MANHGVASFDYTNDVFLSFRRGVHRAFIDHLYKALDGIDIKTFKDDDKEESTTEEEETNPDLIEKIERSRISVVVLCKDFPFSTRCLDEVAKIMECYDNKTMQVVGLFYDGVIAADVRWQKEDRAYGKAITQHKERLGLGEESDKIKTWRSALSRVCDLIALNCDKKYETELISMIVKGVSARLPPLRLQIKDVVGLDSRFEEVKSHLDIGNNDAVQMLAICGPPGIGKTTFAAYIYNNIINHQYIAASFISNIRDKPKVEDLQSTLLSEMGEKRESKRGDTDGGGREIKRKLSVKKVLLVLDGVDKIEQLKSLAGGCDWFGPGSKIIITTRDATLLNRHRVKIKRYQMTELSDEDSRKLFCWYAFDGGEPAQNFANLVPQALSIAKGIPLALKKLGSRLKDRSLDEWEMELDRYNKVPEAFEFLLKSFGN
ncbi:TMV resistance protein N-like [Arachis stenosperma]|uniref:TMV resistance protein N-like n=1 Tax=Arachis stenosperma TaxID=217475 RepID=UPI0025AC8D36|nr:TMV resistance protein N-like [Arachis stenosperma]